MIFDNENISSDKDDSEFATTANSVIHDDADKARQALLMELRTSDKDS